MELLQELRVLQTGVQILAGFLLTLPFQSRFETLDDFQTTLYLANVALAALTTALILLPVSVHRRLFRLRLRAALVSSADRIAKVALAGVGLLSVGTSSLVFDVTAGRAAGLMGRGGAAGGAAGPAGLCARAGCAGRPKRRTDMTRHGEAPRRHQCRGGTMRQVGQGTRPAAGQHRPVPGVFRRHDRQRSGRIQRGPAGPRRAGRHGAGVSRHRAPSSRRRLRTGSPSSCRWACTSS